MIQVRESTFKQDYKWAVQNCEAQTQGLNANVRSSTLSALTSKSAKLKILKRSLKLLSKYVNTVDPLDYTVDYLEPSMD